ncbi:alpha/beta hydrolase [Solimonas sp. K1W22B-7]|uniref:alpha/beta hydrolase n=1 Tax=Solimonas sp. K1W22B-7 TaxID=2303331 RepID=UPI000E334E03|nr:alpha/beta hydrolase [Solimonas sp. K1W22B-7]AXQ29121.1 alpha/beta hydrolase [Solimonas sp. K1W22B-7]
MERHDIEFDSHGTRCRAWLFTPDGTATAPRPCIVMAHGLGGTRDAGLEPFARRFCAAGYFVLLFDYRHFGASDGEPRQLLSVGRQLDDWAAAIAHARGLPQVDGERIALWGSSFSGGHVIVAAARDGKVAAVSAQGPMMDGLAATMNMLQYAGIGRVLKLSAWGITDQLRGLLGLSPLYVPLVAPPGQFAAMSTADSESGYRAITPPGWRNQMSARLALWLATYRPISHAGRVPCPTLICVCKQDSVAPAEAAIRTAEKLGGKAVLKRYDIGHFDIYVGAGFERACADQLAFFQQTLR